MVHIVVRILLIGLFSVSSESNAKSWLFSNSSKEKGFFTDSLGLSTYYISYADVNIDLSVNSANVPRKPAYGVEILLRFYKIFGFVAYMDQSQDSTQRSIGLGVRAYLPGFFLLFGDIKDVLANDSKKRVRSYAQSQIENVRDVTSTSTNGYISSAFRLGMEIRLFSSLYLTAFGGLNNFAGSNLSGHTGGGLTLLF